MEKIYMEKESVARLVLNAVILLVSLFSLVVICIEHHWGIPLCSAILFVLLSALGILVELYECIFYDDTHFAVRSFGGTEEVNFADIESVKREFIRGQTGQGGHWRYFVQFKTDGNEQKQIIVPFPQFVTNRNLQNLFLKISSANDKVKWINIEKTF